jgi:hypothetical protein
VTDDAWLMAFAVGGLAGVLVGLGAEALRRRLGLGPVILVVALVVAALTWAWARGVHGFWGTFVLAVAVFTSITLSLLRWRKSTVSQRPQ